MTDERRQTFRCPIQPDQPGAILEIDRSRLSTVLLDESREGFLVLVDGEPSVEIGTQGILRTNVAREEVRVAHKETAEDGTRLGLVLIQELPDPPRRQGNFFSWFRVDHLRHSLRSDMLVVLAIMALAVFGLFLYFGDKLSSLSF